MKKYYWLVIALGILGPIAKGQDTLSDQFLLRGGVALPVGAFAAQEDLNAGHALAGFHVGVEYLANLKERLHFSVLPGWNSFGLDATNYDYAPGFAPTPENNDLERSRYQQFYVMTGPSYALSTKQLTILPAIRAGLVYNQGADTEIEFEFNGLASKVEIDRGDQLQLGLMPGITFLFDFPKEGKLFTSIDYFYSRPALETKVSSTSGTTTNQSSTESRQPMNALLVTWGISIAFN